MPFPPSEGADHILAVVTVALRNTPHLKPQLVQNDKAAISLLVAFYGTQGLQRVNFSHFWECPTHRVHTSSKCDVIFLKLNVLYTIVL